MSAPKQMKALVEGADFKPAVQTIDVPQLEANDVLIKVAYASQNPTDWKHAAGISPPNAILGCDLAGTVVALGPDLKTPLQVGDRVAGFVHGGLFDSKGAYAEYARAESDLIWKVPDDVKLEDAATAGVPWITAAQALIHSQKKPFPPAKEDEWLLVYGGSTGVGLYALQLAKLQGYKVVTTCSPHNFELVKSYGADAAVDYRAPNAAAQIKEATAGTVRLGLDCISEGDSFKISADAFGDNGGQLNTLLPPPQDRPRKDVDLVMTLAYTLQGKAFDFGPRDGNKMHFDGSASDRAFHVELCKHTPEYFAKHGLRAPPVKIRGGLEDIPAGFEEMKAGKVSGTRLVYKIAA
ncbi:hypothetical protein Q5752_004975 [Cryptotrichosporon argae]